MSSRLGFVVAVLTAVAIGTATAHAAPAAGLYLDLEGGWGFRLVEPYSPYVTGEHAQLTPIDEYTGWNAPNFAIVAPASGRGELGIVLGGGAGLYVRLGTALSGWGGVHRYDADSWANVTCRAGLGKPECEIKICIESPDPCFHYAGQMVRGYAEVAPRALIGFGGQALSVGVGVQAFSGRYFEHFTSREWPTSQPERWREHDDALFATLEGILGVMEAELTLSERARVVLSGGAGVYRGFADGVISDRTADTGTEDPDDFTERAFPVDATFTGVRAQFGLGFLFDVNSHVSIGLMGRADYWSAFPGLTVPSPGFPFCMVRDNGDPVCEPPRVEGEFGVGIAPMIHLSVGVALNLRIGP